MAFRQAGRIAVEEGLRHCSAYLLEPVDKLLIFTPDNAMSSVTAAVSAKRGRILGFGPRDGWSAWQAIEAYLPRSERRNSSPGSVE